MTHDDWPAVKAIYEERIATKQATFEATAPDYETWDTNHLDLVLQRDIELHVRTEQDIAELGDLHGRFARSIGKEFKGERAATNPAVPGVEVRGDQLWVGSSMRGWPAKPSRANPRGPSS